jgi:uncharacterized protein (TIGR02217 family)
MAFLAIQFPPRIAMGAVRTPGWSTDLAENAGGWEHASQNWSASRLELDISFAVRNRSDYQAVQTHFHQARGRAHTFGVKDYLDADATAQQGVLLLVSGSVYQMHKRYGSVNAWDRKITRPDVDTCTFYRTRASVATAITPTVDYTTGRVTVSGHEAGDTYTWAGQFVVPMRYTADKLPGMVINREPGPNGELLVSCESIVLREARE